MLTSRPSGIPPVILQQKLIRPVLQEPPDGLLKKIFPGVIADRIDSQKKSHTALFLTIRLYLFV